MHQTQSPFGKRKWFFQPDGFPDQCQYEARNGTIDELMKRNENGKIKDYSCSGLHIPTTKEIGYDSRGRMKTVENALFSFDFDSPGISTCTSSPGYEIPSDGLDPFGNVLIEQIEGILTLNKYDDAGQLTYRETEDNYKKLSWDPWGRLTSVETETDTWKAAYDPFGRRLRTTHTPDNGTSIITTSLYDPSSEFLEIGVKINGKTFWKVHGSNGLEAIVDDAGNAVGLIHDALGNLIGISANEEEIWNEELPSPYGARGPPSLHYESAIEFAQAHAWRDLLPDPTGYLWMGARYYDSLSGRFLSPDPIGYPITLNLYTYANGDPINFHDPDGRFACAAYSSITPTRIFGGLQAVGGAAEATIGAALCETWIGIPIGVAMIIHGSDHAAAGVNTIIYGEQRETATSMVLQRAGLSRGSAEIIDTSMSIGTTMGATAYLSSTRFATTFASRLAPASSTGYAAATTSQIGVKASKPLIRANVTEAVQPYTRSSLKFGQQMHKSYKLDVPGIKEYRLPSGRRVDFLDIKNRTIFELKPNNPWSIKLGHKQLGISKEEMKNVHDFGPGEWNVILETY